MKDIQKFDLRGRLPIFLRNFLSERTFKIRIGSTLSNLKKQKKIPQGSVLSVTLLSIKINDINCLYPRVDRSLFVGDFMICYVSKLMHNIEKESYNNA